MLIAITPLPALLGFAVTCAVQGKTFEVKQGAQGSMMGARGVAFIRRRRIAAALVTVIATLATARPATQMRARSPRRLQPPPREAPSVRPTT